MASSCEHGNELLSSVKCWVFSPKQLLASQEEHCSIYFISKKQLSARIEWKYNVQSYSEFKGNMRINQFSVITKHELQITDIY
jgi:hypothetical protein